LAAERLFADFGIANVSLRDVGIAAGQKNNGVVQYHFNDRDNLVHEVRVYRAKFIEEKRAELLAKVVSSPNPPQVRDYVNAFVGSLTCTFEEGNYFLRFWSRLVIERGGVSILYDGVVPAGTIAVMKSIMRQLLPALSDEIIEERWEVLTSTTIHMLARYQTELQNGTLRAPLEALLEDLVTFLTAGLQEPPRSGKKQRSTQRSTMKKNPVEPGESRDGY
jgi:AcrR family transcriptional regulator